MTHPTANAGELCGLLAAKPIPMLTWYDDDRIELSGPVLARWISKVDNFLTQEFPFDGDLFHIDLRLSWQRLIWETACRLRGWIPADPEAANLVISTKSEILAPAAKRGQASVALTLAPLELSWPGVLPPGVLDGAAELLGQADTVLEPQSPGRVEVADYSEYAGACVELCSGDPFTVFTQALGLWWYGARIVVIGPGSKDHAERILQQEQVTRHLT